jgi:hypothetical protein
MKKTVSKLTFSERLEKHIFEKGLTCDEMFNSLNVLLDYSGIKTVKQYAQDNNVSVQSVYQKKIIKTILGKKVVFDNY